MSLEKGKKKSKTLGLKIISVILAILLWFYVVNQGALTTGSNLMETELEYLHLPEGLSVNGPTTVYVKLWGVFQGPNELYASVDLKDLKEGTYELPVYVEPVKGAMFTSVQPDKVKVTLEEVEQNSVPISVDIKQNPPLGYELLDIKTVPEKCIIKGAEKDVKKVAAVICSVELGNYQSFTSVVSKLSARDINGNPVDKGITMIPDNATVYAVINQRIKSKKVDIKPVVTGDVPDGYNLLHLIVYPDNVTAIGNEMGLKAMGEQITVEVDLTAQLESFEIDKQIRAPEGVQLYPTTVVVQVEISEDDYQRKID